MGALVGGCGVDCIWWMTLSLGGKLCDLVWGAWVSRFWCFGSWEVGALVDGGRADSGAGEIRDSEWIFYCSGASSPGLSWRKGR